jgi:hypothetical protein
VNRVSLVTLGVIFVIGAVGVFLARAFGASGSRPAALVSVASHWLGAWVVWTFVGGLALHLGLLAAYEPFLFAALSVAGGIVQYRTLVRGAREQARAVFVGVQLLWLVIVLARNGVF